MRAYIARTFTYARKYISAVSDGNPCPLVHHTKLQHFKTPAKRKEFIDFVQKTPGLAWAEGKAPPSESSAN